MQIEFAGYDGLAARFTPNEAWLYSDHYSKWMKIEPADVYKSAASVKEDKFRQIFPDLPPLPPQAFVPRLRRVV